MTTVTLDAVVAPYRGLAPFGESELDALLFFGRERETEIAVANLIGSRLTILYGPSGVGKSSLVRAGVARRIRELGARRALGRGPDLAVVVFASWSDDPLRGIAAAVQAEVAPLVSPLAPRPPDDSPPADVLAHWSALLDGELCLVLDQLEEYFVYHEDEDGPGTLIGELPEIVSRPGLRTNVLLSLRDDALSRLDVFKTRIPNLFANTLRLDRLDFDAARAAILGPVQRWNDVVEREARVHVEPELVDGVLAQSSVAGDAGRVEPPYLQLVMERIWTEEQARGSDALRATTLVELGGAAAIVRDHLDRALGVLDDDGQDAAARMFDHLVTPSGTKIAHRSSDLAEFARLRPSEAQPVLAALGHERILRPLEKSEGAGDRYEIFHDVLAGAILDWRRRRDVEHERVVARRKQRRLAVVAGAALAALAVTIAVALYALDQRSTARAQTRHAQAAALRARALNSLSTEPERSLRLAVLAAQREPSAEVEDVLRSALVSSRGRAVLRGHHGGVLAVAFAPDGVATLDGAGVLRTFPARTSHARTTRSFGARVRAAAFSARGRIVAVARRRLVEVRDVAGGAGRFAFRAGGPIRALALDPTGTRVGLVRVDGVTEVWSKTGKVFSTQPGFLPTSVALDERGRTVAVAGEHRAVVWRVAAGEPIARVTDRRTILGAALAPDGSLLATASSDSSARVWQVPGGALLNVLSAQINLLTSVAFGHGGMSIATLSRDGTTRTWAFDPDDPRASRLVGVLAGHRDAVTAVAFSPGDRLLATGSDDDTARLWDPGIAQELRLLARPPGCCAALVGTSDSAVVALRREAALLRGNRIAVRYPQGSRIAALASSAYVVTAASNGAVRVWRRNGRLVRRLNGGRGLTTVATASLSSPRGGATGP